MGGNGIKVRNGWLRVGFDDGYEFWLGKGWDGCKSKWEVGVSAEWMVWER